jgi:hypothetical protein
LLCSDRQLPLLLQQLAAHAQSFSMLLMLLTAAWGSRCALLVARLSIAGKHCTGVFAQAVPVAVVC